MGFNLSNDHISLDGELTTDGVDIKINGVAVADAVETWLSMRGNAGPTRVSLIISAEAPASSRPFDDDGADAEYSSPAEARAEAWGPPWAEDDRRPADLPPGMVRWPGTGELITSAEAMNREADGWPE